MTTFGTALKEARKHMGWDRRSLATALRMSDKPIGYLETGGGPDWPAADDVLDFMKAYGFVFEEPGRSNPDEFRILRTPKLEHRYFLTLDFRYERNPDRRVHAVARRMRVIGMSMVRRLNQARETASSFDGVELHAPPINRTSFDTVLIGFLEDKDFGPSVDCLVRNREGLRLTADIVPQLWAYGLDAADPVPIEPHSFPNIATNAS